MLSDTHLYRAHGTGPHGRAEAGGREGWRARRDRLYLNLPFYRMIVFCYETSCFVDMIGSDGRAVYRAGHVPACSGDRVAVQPGVISESLTRVLRYLAAAESGAGQPE